MTMNNFAPFVAAFFSVSVCLCICVYLCASMFAVLCTGGVNLNTPLELFSVHIRGVLAYFHLYNKLGGCPEIT